MAERRGETAKPDPESLDAAAVAELIRRIPAAEGLKPGDRIGAERELAQRFGVGRWTVRRALEQLETEGAILRTTNGRSGGVFVALDKVVRDLEELVGLPAYLRSQGMVADTIVLGTSTVLADDDLAAKLEIAPGGWAYRIDRLRLTDQIPLCLESVWLPVEAFPGLLNESMVGSIYDLLESRFGIERGDAVENITAAPATREEAASLQIQPGMPVLVVDRVARLTSGQVFEASEERYRADRTAFVVHATGQHGAKRKVPSGGVTS